jgi:hypothetical protein
MADKRALEWIGLMLALATLCVVSAAGFAVSHELTAGGQRAETVELAQFPAQTLEAGIAPHILK